MDDVCFCSVALTHKEWGDVYLKQLTRLRDSIYEIYPDAECFFWYDELPEGAKPFLESLYGQKVHAINVAQQRGFKRILWLDPAMILVDKIDDLFKFDVIAVKDEHCFYNMISDKCRDYYGLTNEGIKKNDWRLVGGSLYYLDFNKRITQTVFKMWLDAEIKGLFGSQDEQSFGKLQGHRNDETLFAIAMYLNGIEPQDGKDVRYCTQETPMTIKKHFK